MIMMSIYTLVMVGSTLMTSWLGLRVFRRIGRELGLPAWAPQLAISLAMLAFLTVVSMPAGVLIGALLLTVLGAVMRPEWNLTSRPLVLSLLTAALFAALGIWDSPGQWPALLPLPVALLISALVFFGMLETTRRSAPTLLMLGGVTTLAVLPLILAPLVFAAAHSSLAIDSAILLAALLGGMQLLPEDTVAAPIVRLPVALLISYDAIQAMHYGAWPLGIVTLLVFAAGLIFAPRRMQAMP